jgi:hypothetical protein
MYTYIHTYIYTAYYYNDLYCFSAAANTWTALSPSGSRPPLRDTMGFAATPDGMLYVFGGWDDGNGGRRGGAADTLYVYVYVHVYIHNDARYDIDIYTCVRSCLHLCRAWVHPHHMSLARLLACVCNQVCSVRLPPSPRLILGNHMRILAG